MREGEELLERAVASARLLREQLAAEVPALSVINTGRLAATPGVTGVDATHVLIETASIGLTGYRADDWLRDERQIDVELVDHRRLMPLISFAHGEAEIDRLVRALRDLVDATPTKTAAMSHASPAGPTSAARPRCSPATPSSPPRRWSRRVRPPGRISAELVTPYPPGIPAVAPGELYTEENVGYLEAFVAAGGFVEGAADPMLEQLRVVAE